MTKQLLKMAFLLLALVGGANSAWGAAVTVFDASAAGWSADGVNLTTGTTTVGDVTWNGGGSASIASGNATISGVSWTARLKFGGASTFRTGKTLTRVLTFTPSVAGTVRVYGTHGSSSGTRTFYISQSITSTDKDTGTALGSYACTPENKSGVATAVVEKDKMVYIWADNNIGIYGITFEASGPSITTQPVGGNFTSGGSYTLSVVASGTGLSYQWYSCDDAVKTNPNALVGATSASYTATAEGYYYVKVTDSSSASVESNVVLVEEVEATAPTISISGDNSVARGGELTLTAEITGAPTPTIEWFKCDDALKTNPVSQGSASTANTTFAVSTTTVGTYYFYAAASNSAGDAASSVKTITVVPQAPTLTAGCKFEGDSKSVTITKADGEDGSATIQYKIDTGEWTDYSTSLTITATSTVYAKVLQGGLASAEASATYTKFVRSDLADVSEVITWDFSKLTANTSHEYYGSNGIKLTTTTFPSKESANNYVYNDFAGDFYTIGSGFDGSKIAFYKTEYPIRENKYAMGTALKFHTTVPGIVTVSYSNTGNRSNEDERRYLTVNGTKYGDGTMSSAVNDVTTTVSVGAGDVVLSGELKGDGSVQYLRYYTIIFKPIVTATVGSYGYASFSSVYDLDFTDVEGLTAYKAASCDGSTVTLEEVTGKVKAGDGLVIKGTAGSYEIVATTGASTIYDAPGTINMFGCDGSWSTVSKAGSGTNFVLSVQGGKVVFAPVINTDASLSAGQAGLWANVDVSLARTMIMVFGDDETTKIESLTPALSEGEGAFYDLQGRRVAQPTKGLYIVNGHKVVIK